MTQQIANQENQKGVSMTIVIEFDGDTLPSVGLDDELLGGQVAALGAFNAIDLYDISRRALEMSNNALELAERAVEEYGDLMNPADVKKLNGHLTHH